MVLMSLTLSVESAKPEQNDTVKKAKMIKYLLVSNQAVIVGPSGPGNYK